MNGRLFLKVIFFIFIFFGDWLVQNAGYVKREADDASFREGSGFLSTGVI